MRIILIGLVFLAGCDLPGGPARPAPSGITANSVNGDTRFGGADQTYGARGSQNTISAPR